MACRPAQPGLDVERRRCSHTQWGYSADARQAATGGQQRKRSVQVGRRLSGRASDAAQAESGGPGGRGAGAGELSTGS